MALTPTAAALLDVFAEAFRRGVETGLNSGKTGKVRRAGRPGAASGGGGPVLVGQVVSYRQGRGTFAAKVVEVDGTGRVVTLRRAVDGKVVQRPVAKVYA